MTGKVLHPYARLTPSSNLEHEEASEMEREMAQILANLSLEEARKTSEMEGAVLGVLSERKEMHVQEIAEALGKPLPEVRRAISRLIQRGFLTPIPQGGEGNGKHRAGDGPNSR